MTKRDHYVPEDFIKILRRGITGYRQLTPAHQSRMAYYIWHYGTWRRRHKSPKWDDFMTIGYQELERDFGRGGFKAINDTLHIFEVTPNWYSTRGLTKGYNLSPKVQELKERYLVPRKRALTKLIDSEARALRTLPKPVAAKDSNGITATAWNNAKPLNKIPVNMETLRYLYAHLQKMIKQDGQDDMFAQAQQEDFKYIAEAVGQLLRLANVDISERGYVMHRYVEASSGRLYARGVSLQTTPRVIRQAALHGLYEYDFENCHYSIFSQLAARYGFEAVGIGHYLANKKAVREQLAQDIGITLEQVKMCLLAIMYGARANTWHENAIPNEIGAVSAKALYAHPQFQGIAQDINQGRRVILTNWPTRRTTLLNDMGKRIKKNEKPERKLAHLLQGIEAKALRAVIELIPDDVLLLMHDGFVTSRPVDTRAMEQAVCQATGYELSLSGGVITLPPDLHFNSLSTKT